MSIEKEDKMIQSLLQEKAREVEASDTMWNKIRVNIYEKECKEEMEKKRFRFAKSRKVVTTIALCVVMGSITVIGATIGKEWLGSSHLNYRSLPTEATIQKDVGFVPQYVEVLPGGFVFDVGHIGENALRDESGNEIAKAKEISFSYVKDNKKNPVSVSAMEIDKQHITHEESQVVASEGGIDLYYYEKMYKFVPPHYELTEEDKEAKEKGEIEISIGSSEISIEQNQQISWYKDGIAYNIGASDYHFTVEEMIEMAKAVMKQ